MPFDPKPFEIRHPGSSEVFYDALPLIRAHLAYDMRRAREAAGLTQEELGARLRRPEEKVIKTESGEWDISEGHINQLLRVCGLPPDWKPTG